MIIAMLTHMSGGRYDDRQWPAPGVPFEVPDWEGEGLVRWHHAVKVADSPAPQPPPMDDEPAPAVPAVFEPVEEPSLSDPPDPPKPADPKATWVAYAITQGADHDEAEAMTKIDLMSRYGGRL